MCDVGECVVTFLERCQNAANKGGLTCGYPCMVYLSKTNMANNGLLFLKCLYCFSVNPDTIKSSNMSLSVYTSVSKGVFSISHQ